MSPLSRECLNICVPESLHKSVSSVALNVPWMPNKGINYLSHRSVVITPTKQQQGAHFVHEVSEPILSDYDVVSPEDLHCAM